MNETTNQRFRNRVEAGACLAERLADARGQNALVLGIPRGGVPVAAEVARRLDSELDVVIAQKLCAPDLPELAIGAVAAHIEPWLHPDYVRILGVSRDYLAHEIALQREAIRAREAQLRAKRNPLRIAGRTVLVVDDGIETGSTMMAALREVREQRPGYLIAAVPVAAYDAVHMLREEADEVVCVRVPHTFHTVKPHYEDFEQVPDDESQRLLQQAHRTRTA